VEKTEKRVDLVCVLLTKYYLGDKIKKKEIGGACERYGEEESCIQSFGGETLMKEFT
jgi:hypothetical protein